MSVRTLTHCITLVHSLRIGGKLLGQDLQCHVPVQLGIGGTVDLSHASFAYLLKNFVVADRLADHEVPHLVDSFVLNLRLVGSQTQ